MICSESNYLKEIYNFTYRLSGNTGVAQVLTEKVLLRHAANHNDDVILLKQAWKSFLKYYGALSFQGENPIQQDLLVLTAEQRCAVILRDILGFSYQQIADVLEKSEPEMARLLAEGRKMIGNKY